MFSKTKYLLPACCAMLVLLVGSVYATWQYALQRAPSANENVSLTLNEFFYKPEEVIPGGSIEAPLGEDHLELIEMILNEASYGVNATKKPIIHTVLSRNHVIYCDQNVQGGNLKHLMIDSSENADRLHFVISKASDTEYHAFTFSYYDMRNGAIGSEIQVYKTILEKGANGRWTAPRSFIGVAKIFDPGIVSKSIDYTTWRHP